MLPLPKQIEAALEGRFEPAAPKPGSGRAPAPVRPAAPMPTSAATPGFHAASGHTGPGVGADFTASALAQVQHDFGLSKRELEVLALIAEGRSNPEIGRQLYITRKTVAVHVSNILTKLGVSGRVEAAAAAIRLGLTERS
jgi:DNA-binding CsgD family transcriptional regulator